MPLGVDDTWFDDGFFAMVLVEHDDLNALLPSQPRPQQSERQPGHYRRQQLRHTGGQ